MAAWILAAALAWPALLGAALTQHVTGEPRAWSAVVYLAASRVCHQRPERSFRAGSVQWPVCGRCAGIYLGGAAAVPVAGRWLRRWSHRARVAGLMLASLPTVISVVLEWVGAPVSNVLRAFAALPAGAGVILAIVDTLRSKTSASFR